MLKPESRVVIVQRDPRILAAYQDTLQAFLPAVVADSASFTHMLAEPSWGAYVVSSPIGTWGTWELARALLQRVRGAAGRVVVVAQSPPVDTALAVRHLLPSCTRDDLVQAVEAARIAQASLLPSYNTRRNTSQADPYERAVNRAKRT